MFDQKISIKSNMFHLCLVRWIGGWDCLWMLGTMVQYIYIYIYMWRKSMLSNLRDAVDAKRYR